MQTDIYYKLRNRFYIKEVTLLIFSTLVLKDTAAQNKFTRPDVTGKWEQYLEQVKNDSSKRMVELQRLIPGLVYDLRYSGTNNFVQRAMYPAGTNNTFLRWPAARALLSVQAELHGRGMALKIFDAYRPYEVTVKFWKLVKDERYVAHPATGSGHNRGIAVDLTIINALTGKELDMGTGFDNFTDTAHHSFTDLPKEILQHRILLRTIMEKHGFRSYSAEWWHYSLADGNRFEILDISFKKLSKPH